MGDAYDDMEAGRLPTAAEMAEHWRNRYNIAAAERDTAVARADRLREALDELTVEHRPMWSAVGRAGFTLDEQPGYKPVGCCMCFPADGSWPCATRLIVDAAEKN